MDEARGPEQHTTNEQVSDAAIEQAFLALSPPQRRTVEYAAMMTGGTMPAAWIASLLEADAALPAARLSGTPETRIIALPPATDAGLTPAQSVVQSLVALQLLRPADEHGNQLRLQAQWEDWLTRYARQTRTDWPDWIHAISMCAIERIHALEKPVPDTDGEDRRTPRAIADTSLQWELAPLIDVCKNLWAATYYLEGLMLGNDLANLLEEVDRLDEAAACLPLTAEIDALLADSWFGFMLAVPYKTLARVQWRQDNVPAAIASMQRAIVHLGARLQHMATTDEPADDMQYFYRGELGRFHAFLAELYAEQHDLSAAITHMEQAIAHNDPRVRYRVNEADTDEEVERSWREDLALDHASLASLYAKQSNFPAARASYHTALTILLADVGEDDPEVVHIREALRNLDQAE
ncbi:MAG TPA: hypothetical protein VK157_01500 [Phycisphaerales bacterium]|nr:hypothetical protein [Phycisphaerales bacterium]